MAIYDEVHDIRYLHDDKAPHDHEPTKLPDFRKFLKYKRLGTLLGMIVVFGGVGILIFNISQPQDTRSRASESETGSQVIVRGTVTCVKDENDECELSITTDEGDTVELEKTADQNLSSNLKDGDYVVVKGTVLESQGLIGSGNNKKITIENLQSLGSAKTPTPTKVPPQTSGDPTPTVNNTPLVTPTPSPQVLKNNNPEPGVEYVTATYVIDNKETLNGQTVNVQSFLVGGYIGTPGCSFETNCNESHFLLNDSNAEGRDINYDLQVIGGTTDLEGDYAPGQEFFTTGKVYLVDNVAHLEKIK